MKHLHVSQIKDPSPKKMGCFHGLLAFYWETLEKNKKHEENYRITLILASFGVGDVVVLGKDSSCFSMF